MQEGKVTKRRSVLEKEIRAKVRAKGGPCSFGVCARRESRDRGCTFIVNSTHVEIMLIRRAAAYLPSHGAAFPTNWKRMTRGSRVEGGEVRGERDRKRERGTPLPRDSLSNANGTDSAAGKLPDAPGMNITLQPRRFVPINNLYSKRRREFQ